MCLPPIRPTMCLPIRTYMCLPTISLLCDWLLCARQLPQVQILLQLSIVNTRRLATRLTCQCLTPRCWLVTRTMYLQKYLAKRFLFILCQCFYCVPMFLLCVIVCHCLTFDISKGYIQCKLSLHLYNVQCLRVKRVAQEIWPEESLLPVKQLFFQYLQSKSPWNLLHSSYFFFSPACFLINVKILV